MAAGVRTRFAGIPPDGTASRDVGMLRRSGSAASMGRTGSAASMGRTGSAASLGSRSVQGNRDFLARAGWSVLSTGSLPPMEPPVEMNKIGQRIVGEVAKSWSSTYQHTIRPLGLHEGSYHYECIFSLPTEGKPVPSKVLRTMFALVVPPRTDHDRDPRPRLFYSFEEGDLRHEWLLEKQKGGEWCATDKKKQAITLGSTCFEGFIDGIIREKQTSVNMYQERLATNFEVLRMKPPPAYDGTDDPSMEDVNLLLGKEGTAKRDEADPEVYQLKVVAEEPAKDVIDVQSNADLEAMKQALKAAGLACDLVAPPSSMHELLQNIFDAADEEGRGELPHYEVARLLGAMLPGFGLEEWDIHKLLAGAEESEDGMIELEPFLEAAPGTIAGLLSRRMAYKARGLPGADITAEAVHFCFDDEVMETVSMLMKVFEASWLEDEGRGKGTVTNHNTMPARKMTEQTQHSAMEQHLPVIRGTTEDYTLMAFKRCFARDCIAALPERLGPQQVERLMQFLPEDEDGFLYIDTFNEQLEAVHQQAIVNAIIENDLSSLWAHLVSCFRKAGVAEDGKLKLWYLKKALLGADQTCLSRLQIHTLLCLASPATDGQVDVVEFLAVCCHLIQHMFNAKIFAETAERLQLEHAELSRKAENAELAAFAASTVIQANKEEEGSADHEVDVETVEKTLIQALNLSDDTRRNPPVLPPETVYGILCGGDVQVQSCQLSHMELVGLAAEMSVDVDGQVQYVDFIKRWVPVVFELRKNQLLAAYLQENALEGLSIPPPDVDELQKETPLVKVHSQGARRASRSTRKPSKVNDEKDGEDVVVKRPIAAEITRTASNETRSSKITFESMDGDMEEDEHRQNSRTAGSTSLQVTQMKGLRKSMVERTRRSEGSQQPGENPHGRGFERRKAKLIAAEEARKKEPEPPQVPENPKHEDRSPKRAGRRHA